VAKIELVFEIKNNSAPIVMLTNFKNSPNLTDWLAIKRQTTVTVEVVDFQYAGFWGSIF